MFDLHKCKMRNMTLFLIFIHILCLIQVQCQQIGEECEFEGKKGHCKLAKSCPEAIAAIKMNKRPTLCSFMNDSPVVCCVPNHQQNTAIINKNINSPFSLTDNSKCSPVSGITDKKNGQKAWDKCIDLGEIIYACDPDTVILLKPTYSRRDMCSHNTVPLVVGGTVADKNEFPHMALLGFGEETNILWPCGGTLISEQWVMTAGKCLRSGTHGDVKYIRFGNPNLNDVIDPDYLYTVARTVKHPKYTTESFDNDIGLIQTDRIVIFDERVIPACLHTGNQVDDSKPIATGWGTTEYAGERSSTLQKVILQKYSYEECYQYFRPTIQELKNETQLCAGHRTESQAGCLSDSGGPLQIYNTGVRCTYLVIGITSSREGCGELNVPSVYTRVSTFVPWIESIVWP